MAVGVCFEGVSPDGRHRKFCTREPVDELVAKFEALGWRGVVRRRGIVIATVGGG